MPIWFCMQTFIWVILTCLQCLHLQFCKWSHIVFIDFIMSVCNTNHSISRLFEVKRGMILRHWILSSLSESILLCMCWEIFPPFKVKVASCHYSLTMKPALCFALSDECLSCPSHWTTCVTVEKAPSTDKSRKLIFSHQARIQ